MQKRIKKKDKTIHNYIQKEIGIEISPFLEYLLKNPFKVEHLRCTDLEKVVKEYAPIHRWIGHRLDGPREMYPILNFELSLLLKTYNKPEIKKMLEDYKHDANRVIR